jgi:hypothetical protein
VPATSGVNDGVASVPDDREADELAGRDDKLHAYVNDGLATHAHAAVAPTLTSSPVTRMPPPYGWPLSSVIDMSVIVGAAQFESIVVSALPLTPDFCPVATTLRTYVPGEPGVKVGVAAVESLKSPPPGGPDTTDHAYEYVCWNRAGHVATSSSSDDKVAVSECGSIGMAGAAEIDTTGAFAPHDPDEMVKSVGAEAFPSESCTTTLTWYVPATSGTSDGADDDPDDSVA